MRTYVRHFLAHSKSQAVSKEAIAAAAAKTGPNRDSHPARSLAYFFLFPPLRASGKQAPFDLPPSLLTYLLGLLGVIASSCVCVCVCVLVYVQYVQ